MVHADSSKMSKSVSEGTSWCRSESHLSRGLGAAHPLGQDRDVAQLQPVVHHEVVVADADIAESLQGGVLYVHVLVIQEVVERVEHGVLGLRSPFEACVQLLFAEVEVSEQESHCEQGSSEEGCCLLKTLILRVV